MNAEIRIPGPDGWPKGQILIDGEPLRGVTGFTLDHSVRDFRPRLDVALNVRQLETTLGDVELHIADGARETLIKFGWTPPANG